MEKPKILGEVIRQKIREDGRTAQSIAQELGMSRGNLDKIYHKESLNSDLLAKLSLVLNHDFFMYVNPFRTDDSNIRQFIPRHGRVAESQAPFHTSGDQVRELTLELDRSMRELEYLEQNLTDVKKSLADKDEIIALQKDKIAYLIERLNSLKDKKEKK